VAQNGAAWLSRTWHGSVRVRRGSEGCSVAQLGCSMAQLGCDVAQFLHQDF
jgi:hypothetical protein